MIKKIHYAAISMSALSAIALPCQAANPSSQAIIAELSPYISVQDMALGPTLLRSDDIKDLDLSRFAPAHSAETPENLYNSPIKSQEPESSLEQLYNKRCTCHITQFGYNALSENQAGATTEASAAIQDSYILERGDEINILIRGQANGQASTTVNNEGQLIIDTLPPVAAAGRTLREVRAEIEAYSKELYNTEIYVSLAKTTNITITIAGAVNQPGQYDLTSFASVIDALKHAGGVSKSGTLRQIKLIRDGKSALIDLYGILVYGSGTSNLSLRHGDRLVIGPIGPTIAIAGKSKRPGIYEILPAGQSLWTPRGERSQKLSLSDLMDLSGGTLSPAQNRFIKLSLDPDIPAEPVNDSTEKIFEDGDIVMLSNPQNKQDRVSGAIEVKGETPLTGLYTLAETPSLSHILRNDKAITSSTYPLIGIIERWDEKHLAHELIAFSPIHIINGNDNFTLHESDTIILFSRKEILSASPRQDQTDIITPNPDTAEEPSSTLQKNLSPTIKDFLSEHAVFLRGSIRTAGAYPVTDNTTLEEILAVAGGASLEANLRSVEITQPLADKTQQRTTINLNTTPASLITLHPSDTIRISQNFRKISDKTVLLSGEVKNPGTYDIIAGDSISKLIARAGGLTDDAYPSGAIFSRKSERVREEQQYKAQAQQLELRLASSLEQKDKTQSPSPDEIGFARNLIAELKNAQALGRITIEANPDVLTTSPELDMLLESGDRLYIPKRPLSVRVAGEVLSPATLQFRSGKDPRTYIDQAGGFTYNADSDRAFVVYPDGSANPLAVSNWNHKDNMIPPGSTIIVPRDPKPLTFMDGAKDLSQILANLATTAIFAEDIANGD